MAPLAACGGAVVLFPAEAPSLVIRSDVIGEARAPFTVTFFFSDDVELPGGNLLFNLTGGSVVAGSFRRLDARTASVQIQPSASARGLIDLRVPAGAFRDATGTAASTVAYAFAQPYDTLPPFATLSFGGPMNSLGFITGPGTFTLRFSSALDAPLTATRLAVSTGSISAFTKTSAGNLPDVYTFSYTPPAATFGSIVFELPPGSVTSGGIANDGDYWSFGLGSR
jgi:hypothetical protein